jgi:hypothetical protein
MDYSATRFEYSLNSIKALCICVLCVSIWPLGSTINRIDIRTVS